MKWQKIGKIFDPSENTLSDGCSEFAKSPQAIEFENFVRVYFCSQKKTSNGKYLSCPQFVDYSKDFKKILNRSTKTVVGLGRLGDFDEHGIFPINVLKHKDKYLAFTSGWSRRTSVSIDMSIGLAISDDQGQSFRKFGQGGPLLSATVNEPFLVGDAFVKVFNGTFYMWYIFGEKWQRSPTDGQPERFYKIAQATSTDGISWNRSGNPVVTLRIENECQALPSVVQIGSRFHMYFCFRDAYAFRKKPEHAYRLGYAYSDDLINWIRDDENSGIEPSVGEWDSDMMCYPNIFQCDNETYLLYNGNEFGRYGYGLAKLINT